MKVKYEGKIYNAYTTDDFGYDEIVCINGVIGYVDFIGEEIIVIIDERGIMHKIYYLDIEVVQMLQPINFGLSESAIQRIRTLDWRCKKRALLSYAQQKDI